VIDRQSVYAIYNRRTLLISVCATAFIVGLFHMNLIRMELSVEFSADLFRLCKLIIDD